MCDVKLASDVLNYVSAEVAQAKYNLSELFSNYDQKVND